MAGPEAAVNQLNRAAYLSVGNFNVIVVDWSLGANGDYVLTRTNVPSAGAVVAAFIDFLHQHGGLRLTDLTVVGHSLGAHIAGMAGKKITKGTIQNIVGLDPALPLFPLLLSADRLDATDAKYVQIVSTDAWHAGYGLPIGHASFYPNWGSNQNRCDGDDGCSHGRAVEYL